MVSTLRAVGLLCLVLLCAPALGQGTQLLHLPGVGGHLLIDDRLTRGLFDGQLKAEIEIYDWTAGNPGLPALGNVEHHRQQADNVAERITAMRRANPKGRLIITSHSGGTAIAVWALERLPADVQIDCLLMLASALSPQYDLSRALARVNGAAYAFNSRLDPIVGLGTRTLGTMDRLYVEAAGNVGFSMPPAADARQYAKLTEFPYDGDWMRLGNTGEHIGAMNRAFAARMLAPLLLTGKLPKLAPTSQPAK